jgi:hypothetical protein
MKMMRLYCTVCGKSVSTEMIDETIVRAALICPECVDEMSEDGRLELEIDDLVELREKFAKS